jgi:hypothetical protein
MDTGRALGTMAIITATTIITTSARRTGSAMEPVMEVAITSPVTTPLTRDTSILARSREWACTLDFETVNGEDSKREK